jgi:hypothetical protein
MSATATPLHLFAYGEHLDGPQQRSLGFRLLAPAEPKPWAAEVESLARGLQAAPYPDPWPPTDLFCSVLLGNGQRVVAVARYGLADHTPSRRRSGLELIGVVAPAGLGVSSALAIYEWLKQRRSRCDDLHKLAFTHTLEEVLAAAPPQPLSSEALPVLPIRLWQEGTLLFAATAPSDADRRLALLQQGASENWQWLPLVGGDFPLASYAQRGPLIAWTPHLDGVALRLDARTSEARTPKERRSPQVVAYGFLLLMLLLVVAVGWSLWGMFTLTRQLDPLVASAAKSSAPLHSPTVAAPVSDPADRERLATAIYHLLAKRGAVTDKDRSRLTHVYEGLLAEDESLRVSSPEGKAALGALDELARRGPGQVEAIVRDALSGKGYDPELIERACRLVRERLSSDSRGPR